jgi:hypothetical protein
MTTPAFDQRASRTVNHGIAAEMLNYLESVSFRHALNLRPPFVTLSFRPSSKSSSPLPL